MTDDEKSREPLTLKRWSARKRAATATPTRATESTAPQPPAAPSTVVDPAPPPSEAPALPPLDSLTFESDFTPFLKPDIDETLKRAALKKLLRDPRFNVMDGLDVYIDDYSKPDPIEPDIVKQLVQGRYLFNPPKTRVTKEGFVEDVPPEEEAANPDGAAPSPAIAHDDARDIPLGEIAPQALDDKDSTKSPKS